MVAATDKLNGQFYFIFISSDLDNQTWLLAMVVDGTVPHTLREW